MDQDTRQLVNDLIYESCLRANDGDWNGYLSLCDEKSFTYRILNYSPEIKKEQSWMVQTHASLTKLLTLLPKHNSDHSSLTRHATIYKMAAVDDHVTATTIFSLYRTQLDGASSHFESGKTSLFAVGRYEDKIGLSGSQARFLSRIVRLETRQLDIGTHYLF